MDNNFIEEYFLRPIVEHSGYNIVNTFVYALIAITAAYFIYKWLKPKFTKRFVLYLIPFVLLGSTVRVITDSIDSGVAVQHVNDLFGIVGVFVNSGIYNYSPFTVTPGIYLVTAFIVFLSIFISDLLKNQKILPAIGIVLWLPHFIILIPLFINWNYIFLILFLLALSFVFSYIILKKLKISTLFSQSAVLAHALDGSASFVAIEVFNRLSKECLELGRCYFGQHVVERTLGEFPYGTALFLLIKILFAIFACYIIERECKDEKEKNFFYTLIIIFGLAPGIRNTLRLLANV